MKQNFEICLLLLDNYFLENVLLLKNSNEDAYNADKVKLSTITILNKLHFFNIILLRLNDTLTLNGQQQICNFRVK